MFVFVCLCVCTHTRVYTHCRGQRELQMSAASLPTCSFKAGQDSNSGPQGFRQVFLPAEPYPQPLKQNSILSF